MKKRPSCVVGMFVCVCSGEVQPFDGPAELICSGWCAVIMAMYVVNLYMCFLFPGEYNAQVHRGTAGEEGWYVMESCSWLRVPLGR